MNQTRSPRWAVLIVLAIAAALIIALLLTGCTTKPAERHGTLPSYVSVKTAEFNCDGLAKGSTYDQLVAFNETGGLYTENDARSIVDASIKAYCPKFTNSITPAAPVN